MTTDDVEQGIYH